MALTESRLRRIIREEAAKVMKEGPYSDRRDWGTMYDRGPGARYRQNRYDDEEAEIRGGGGRDEHWDEEEHDDEDFEGDDY